MVGRCPIHDLSARRQRRNASTGENMIELILTMRRLLAMPELVEAVDQALRGDGLEELGAPRLARVGVVPSSRLVEVSRREHRTKLVKSPKSVEDVVGVPKTPGVSSTAPPSARSRSSPPAFVFPPEPGRTRMNADTSNRGQSFITQSASPCGSSTDASLS